MMPVLSTPTPPAKLRPAVRRPASKSATMAFLSRAAALPGKSLALAVALIAAAISARSPTVSCGRWVRSQFALSPDAVCDGLTRLEAAGMVRASRRRGRHPIVTLLDSSGDELVLEGWPATV
jgi:DNA-binding transcriptional ArsR family regulator